MYSVEWQNDNSLMATLLWLVEKIRPNDVDNIISAKFPILADIAQQ